METNGNHLAAALREVADLLDRGLPTPIGVRPAANTDVCVQVKETDYLAWATVLEGASLDDERVSVTTGLMHASLRGLVGLVSVELVTVRVPAQAVA